MNTTRSAEAPSNSFEAWKYLFEDTTLKGVALRGLAFQLLGFWNMDGKGRCNPSRTTLMARTGIKSKDTLRKLTDELVLGGHFAVVQPPGRSTQYYPMFVKNARTDLLEASQQEVRDRLAGKKSAPKPVVSEKVAVHQTTPVEDVVNDVSLAPEVPSVDTASHRFGSWVKTEADLVIANEYDALLAYNAENPNEADPTGLPVLTVVSDAAATGLTDLNTRPLCAIAGSMPLPTNALPARWVEKWGGNYGSKKFSISQIAELYNELLEKTFTENLPYSTVHEVDVAMHVLGQDGFVPTRKSIYALRYAPELDARMSKLRVAYQETLIAREFCHEHILRGNYDTTTDNR